MEPDHDSHETDRPSSGQASKSTSLSYFILALAAVIALSAILIYVVRSRELQDRNPPKQLEQGPGDKDSATLPTGDGQDPGGSDPTNPVISGGDIDPEDYSSDPTALMREMTKALNELDMERFNKLSGGTIDPKAAEALRDFAANLKAAGLDLESREVGETGVRDGRRWAVEAAEAVKNGERDRVYFDLKKGPKGWVVERVILPGADPEAMIVQDPLAAAEAFLLAVLSQNFEEARKYTGGGKISDARIAGLCIVFEEGRYQLREQKPLRALLKRENFAAYLANVVSSDGSPAAQFGLNLGRESETARWMVTEINLDKLLADYAQRVAGGDVYYSPLVRNPEGGDTLALYFGFDEDEINPRTKRQLEIVAAILKTDPVKKLTLSGHTDSKGTDDYNKSLSMRRAEAVREFLLDAGVEAAQVVTLAKGDSEPRRPNVTESGEDNPEGRRANRRTEIYLDF